MDHAVAHATLGIPAEATPEEIRTAYRRRAFETHPDRAGGSASAFQAVAEAYRTLCELTAGDAQEPDPQPGLATSSRAPATDGAKVLFKYLTDLASEMILNGATPDAVASFLAGEGCPESVARALEQDLRARVQPAASEAAATAPPRHGAGRQDGEAVGAATPREPAAAPRRAPKTATSFPRWPALVLAAAAVTACALLAWRSAATPRSSEPPSDRAPAPAVAVAPPGPIPAPTAGIAAPVRASPARPRPHQRTASRPPARGDDAESLRALSAELDAERDALEADRNRLTAEAADLQAERRRIEAAEAALGAGTSAGEVASLRRQEAAYDARLAAARRMEEALQRRARDLNAKLVAYNTRVISARQR